MTNLAKTVAQISERVEDMAKVLKTFSYPHNKKSQPHGSESQSRSWGSRRSEYCHLYSPMLQMIIPTLNLTTRGNGHLAIDVESSRICVDPNAVHIPRYSNRSSRCLSMDSPETKQNNTRTPAQVLKSANTWFSEILIFQSFLLINLHQRYDDYIAKKLPIQQNSWRWRWATIN